MEKNNELVVYGENGEIVECGFRRIDLNTPSTIVSYCSDVIDEIGNVLDSTAKLSIESEQVLVDNERIKQISSFGEQLDESDKERNSFSLIRKGKKFLANIGIKFFQQELEKDTYQGRYDAYCDMLGEVDQVIERQKQSTLNDIEFIDNIIHEMSPLIAQLDLMIEVGEKDLSEYDTETEQLKLNSDPSDINAARLISRRRKISEAFKAKLSRLRDMLISYNQQIDSYEAQQFVDMQIVGDKEDYLRHSSPLLKSQGSLMVNNRLQAERLEQSKALNAAVNNAITENAKQLLTNIKTAVDLSINGGITIETLKAVDTVLKDALAIAIDGAKQKQEKVRRTAEEHRKLKESHNNYNAEFLNLIDSSLIETPGIEETSITRRLGGK